MTKRHPLNQSFEKTAQDAITKAVAAFPDKLERLMVMLLPSKDMPVYVSPKVASELTGKTGAVRKAVGEISLQIKRTRAAGFADRNFDIAGTAVDFIAVADRKMATDCFCILNLQELQAISALYHEIGHLVVRNGIATSENLSECAAEAFSTLCLIQLFGKNAGLIGNLRTTMIERLVLQTDTAHYTVAALERAIEKAAELIKETGEENFSLIPMTEIAKMAAQIAGDTRLRPERIKKLSAAFQPVANFYHTYTRNKSARHDSAPNAMVYKKVATTMQEHQDNPDVIMAARRFFNLPDKKEFVTRMAETSDFWRDMRDFINTDSDKPKADRIKPSQICKSLEKCQQNAIK